MTNNPIQLSTVRGKLVLAATIFASGMAFLDGSIVTVALPRLQNVFHLTLAGIQWVTNGYTLALSALILTAGALGDRYGHRRVFSIGIALFTIGSTICGLAPTGSFLIGARIFQGIGGALMVPGSLTLLRTNFAANEQGKAIGYWAGFSGGLAALGPYLGGLIVTHLDWRWIFLINLPLGIAAYLLTERVVPADEPNKDHVIDWAGTLTIIIALSGLCIGLIQGEATKWGSLSIAAAVIGVVSLIAFVIAEAKAKHPMVPLSMFRIAAVSGANIATFCIYGALAVTSFFLALNFQQLQGYPADQAGLASLPPILIITFLSGPFGGLSNRFGLKAPLALGTAIVGTGMALLALSPTHASYWTNFFPGLALFGLGMSLVISPITQAALTVPPRSTGAASGMNNAVARFAGLAVIAALGAIAGTRFSSELANRPAAISSSERSAIVTEADSFGGATVPASVAASSQSAAKTLIQESFHASLQQAVGSASALVFLSTIIILFTIPGLSKKPTPTS